MAMASWELDHVQLTVPKAQETEAVEFYATTLGLTRISKPAAIVKNGGAWFQIGGGQLHIGVEDVAIANNRDSKRHVCLRVNDLEGLRDRLQHEGVAIHPDLQPSPGVNRFYLRDPGGNRVEIVESRQARRQVETAKD
jgi:catechol 2,3-dioxygenase-like lactoylglutathione lyase family enzyme